MTAAYRRRGELVPPSDRKIEDYELRKTYARLFSTPDGVKVLDHIVQNICGVDAVVQVATDAQAFEVLARKNVGLMIARLALEPVTREQTVEVRT